jgi:hypothetical protein
MRPEPPVLGGKRRLDERLWNLSITNRCAEGPIRRADGSKSHAVSIRQFDLSWRGND